MSKKTSLRDSTIQKTPTIVTPTNPTISNCADVVLYAKTVLGNHKLMSNNINKVKRKWDICNNMFNISDALSKQKENSLNKFCPSCYETSNGETLLSKELKDGNKNTIIISNE